jgi:hypothetical protein
MGRAHGYRLGTACRRRSGHTPRRQPVLRREESEGPRHQPPSPVGGSTVPSPTETVDVVVLPSTLTAPRHGRDSPRRPRRALVLRDARANNHSFSRMIGGIAEIDRGKIRSVPNLECPDVVELCEPRSNFALDLAQRAVRS